MKDMLTYRITSLFLATILLAGNVTACTYAKVTTQELHTSTKVAPADYMKSEGGLKEDSEQSELIASAQHKVVEYYKNLLRHHGRSLCKGESNSDMAACYLTCTERALDRLSRLQGAKKKRALPSNPACPANFNEDDDILCSSHITFRQAFEIHQGCAGLMRYYANGQQYVENEAIHDGNAIPQEESPQEEDTQA